MNVSLGLKDHERAMAVDLYWQAFGAKLGKVLGPTPRAHEFIARVMRSNFAIVARDDDEQLLGVAGFKTSKGALVGGTFTDLRAIYGLIGACWRAAVLSLIERDTENRRFLLDGLFVAPDARGKGVGTALLDAAGQEALKRGYPAIRLDVVDINPRAQDLYARLGFVAVKTTSIWPFERLFGFRTAVTMVKELAPKG